MKVKKTVATSGLLAVLDEAARNETLPTWDNAKHLVGRMRVTGFRWGSSSALVFEKLSFHRADDTIACDVYLYTTAQLENGHHLSRFLIDADCFSENLGDGWIRSKVTGTVYSVTDDTYSDEPVSPVKEFNLKFKGRKLALPVELPQLNGKRLKNAKLVRRIPPREVVFLQLCDTVEEQQLFHKPAELKRALALPTTAQIIFRFDDWQHPAVDASASSSPDLVAMCRALDGNGPIETLPGKANCNFRAWLDVQIDLHVNEDGVEWGSRGINPKHTTSEPLKLPSKAIDRKPTKPSTAPRTGVSKGSAKLGSAPVTSLWLDDSSLWREWTDANQLVGAARVSGFVSRSGPALLLQNVYVGNDLGIHVELFAYGPAVAARNTKGAIGTVKTLVAWQQLFEPRGKGLVHVRFERGDLVTFKVNELSLRLSMDLPPLRRVKLKDDARLAWLRPSDIALYNIVSQVQRSELFLEPEALMAKAELPTDAQLLFTFDDWQQPEPGKPLTSSPDVGAMVASLDAGERLDVLQGQANCQWPLWLDTVLSKRRKSDGDQWSKDFRHADAPR